ncbi:hypothetical protein AUR66_18185 [Haloferax profundi]|uniref:Histidine kinase domain-containing protein n=1 Tax=Haloferax profundi TaxID=1544718 RepID=A0A0W1RZ93_9EURY|nr:hypothetical protein AUR66_18185 [Haloferax profundi]
MKQALAGFVEDGVKHSSGDPYVSVLATDNGAYVKLTVRDNEPGTEAMEAEVISTGHETSLEHVSGLGLWLATWLVTRYSGSFRIEAAEEDKQTGTTATLKLPALDHCEPHLTWSLRKSERVHFVCFSRRRCSFFAAEEDTRNVVSEEV